MKRIFHSVLSLLTLDLIFVLAIYNTSSFMVHVGNSGTASVKAKEDVINLYNVPTLNLYCSDDKSKSI